MKKKTIILIDGENISAKKAEKITALSKQLGTVAYQKVYHRQKDPSTRQWTEKSKGGDFEDIQLYGDPAKNKVDRKIQKDARRYMKEPGIGAICVVTSDGGFRCLAEDAAAAGKKLFFIGEKKSPEKLRMSGTRFVELS